MLTLALVALSMAVVNWGLQYKMSLYHNGQPHASVAKLWTGSKDAAQAVRAPLPRLEPLAASSQFTLLIALLAFFLPLFQSPRLAFFLRWRRAANTWKVLSAFFRRACLLRPPPVRS